MKWRRTVLIFSRRSRKNRALQSPMNKAFCYAYILVSRNDDAIHYTGTTSHLRQRLREHNRGKVPNSSSHRPWRIETVIAFKSETKARAFEKYLKSGSGREFARRHF
ncbi:MAG TPA: GIY-YIG nuclease family protein [Chthoniobacterales bacterium]